MIDQEPIPPNPDSGDGCDGLDRSADVPSRSSSSRRRSSSSRMRSSSSSKRSSGAPSARRSSSRGSRSRRAATEPLANVTSTNDQTIGGSASQKSSPTTANQYDTTALRPITPRYQTISEVGRGGWGVVQRSRDVSLNREVAVKRFVDGNDATNEEKQRFLDEARLTSQLQHPGIIPVHELNQDGEAFYVMKLLEGETLGDSIHRFHRSVDPQSFSRFQFGEALEPLLQRFISICNAIGYAHEKGIIHRDLKPANIMVGEFGETIVLDWGLAVEVSTQSNPLSHNADTSPSSQRKAQTGATEIIGTPSYMSPEQARGEPASLRCTTDIHSLGMILLAIVSDKKPFSGLDVTETLRRVRTSEFPKATEHQRKTPPALAAIIDKAIHPDPEQRYPSAVELGRDVRRFVAGDSVSVHQENPLDRTLRWCRHHRAIASISAISLATLVVASMTFAMFVTQAHQKERQLRHAAETEHRKAVASLVQSRETIDAWLIELSGTLQFYPGMDHLRNQLLDQAIVKYELIAEESHQNTLRSQTDQLSVSAESPTFLSAIECVKAHLRLGDLHRLTGNRAKARQSYENSRRVLNRLDASENSSVVRPVSLSNQPHDTPSAFDHATPLGRDWPNPKTLLDLERVNLLIAEILLTDTNPKNTLPHLDSLTNQIDPARGWIFQQAKKASELPEARFSSNATRFMNAAVRFEISLARNPEWEPSVQTQQNLEDAVSLAGVLCDKRGTTADRRLREQIQSVCFDRLKRDQKPTSAREVLDQQINDLLEWRNQSPERIDVRQSLAHALIQRANLLGDARRKEHAITDYQAGISELEKAWQMTDGDAFFRTNLATAQSNLGTLLVGQKASRDQAYQLLATALSSYQELLRETATPDRLRRFARTHHSLMKCFDELSDQRLQHAADCASAFGILQSHQNLRSADLQTWIDAEKVLIAEYRLRDREEDAAVSVETIHRLSATLAEF